MPSTVEAVLDQIAKRVTPDEHERRKMVKLSDSLMRKVEEILARASINGTVTLQGSFARDTWLRGETDIDIFIRFPTTMDRKEWIDNALLSIKKHLSQYHIIERYAEHPFLEFHVDGIRVNIVPCYDVSQGAWKSATDRTPFHTEYMKTKLTSDLRREARLLKKFAKAIGVYGAEIEVGGFSGMLVDTLALYHGSFLETMKQARTWTPGTRLEIGKPASYVESKKREVGVDLVVIDPVDPDRNLAAAVRPERLWTFVAAGRQFLKAPGPWFFFPPRFTKKTKADFARLLDQPGHEIVAVSFRHRDLVPDVLWGQLLKLERSLVDLLAREDFQIYRSKIWSDEKHESAILMDVEQSNLPSLRVQRGPPIYKTEDSNGFLDRHLGASDTIRGPWVDTDRWMIAKKRKISSIATLVKTSLRLQGHGLAVPKQIGEILARTVKVHEGREVLSLIEKDGFDETLWNFLEAKPQWLRQGRP
ncbi:MAG TPA: CCA tRNA nucleotidyltransferase [Candidatus Bathyarchaeia archaeon]|nr:CCA tRNA nucleotidyltransferase [Candidatus Bathyarchaeia archaeon]